MQILDAAKYIIHLSYSVKSRSLTLSKLQAILYLAQGWSYVWDNTPLLEDDFIVRDSVSGVMNETIYKTCQNKSCFRGLIEIPETYGCIPVAMTEDEKETLKIVWITYSDKNVFQLGDMIKKQEIWKDGETLNKEKIGEYFKKNYCY